MTKPAATEHADHSTSRSAASSAMATAASKSRWRGQLDNAARFDGDGAAARQGGRQRHRGQLGPFRAAGGISRVVAVRLEFQAHLAQRSPIGEAGVGDPEARPTWNWPARRRLADPPGRGFGFRRDDERHDTNLPDGTDKPPDRRPVSGIARTLYPLSVFCMAPASTLTAGPPLPNWQTLACSTFFPVRSE